MDHITKFRMRVELQFQQKSKIMERNFFDLYLSDSDCDSEFEEFDPENLVPLWCWVYKLFVQ